MELTDEEIRMYKGEYGKATQRAIKFLITYGEAFGAKRLIKIMNVRLGGVGYVLGEEVALEWVKELADDGAHFRVETIIQAHSVDFDNWQKMGIPENLVNNQKRTNELYIKMGAMPVYSCIPHTSAYVIGKGEHFCWAGSECVIFANSVLGALGNREGVSTCVMAGITGRVPEHGFHLEESRYGDVLVDLTRWDFNSITYSDLVAIGYRIGEVLQDKIPVIIGINAAQLTHDQLRWMLVGMPLGGATTLCHVVGVTSEANNLEEAFGGREPKDKIEVTKSEISNLFERLTTAKTEKIDMVCFGCPFIGYEQLKEVASYLEGQKIHPDVKLWIGTDCGVKAIAARSGIVETIEKAGGIVCTEMCVGPLGPFNYIKGLNTVATDNVRNAYYISGISAGKISIWLGDTKRCINAAIKGRWE